MAAPTEAHPILVTAGTGFLGTHCGPCLDLATARASRSARRSLRRLPRECADGPRIRPRERITDHGLLEALFEQYRFRDVYHLAAHAAEGLSHFIRRFNCAVTQNATR